MPINDLNNNNGLTFRTVSVKATTDLSAAPDTFDRESRSVEVVAATEARVQVFDWDRWEIVDEVLLMSGCELPESRKIILFDSHDRSSTQAILGSASKLRKRNNELLSRVVFSKVGAAEDAMTKVEEGHVDNFSVGYRIKKSTWVKDGETTTIQGETFDGPVRVGTMWAPVELSICPFGADPHAKARNKTNATKGDIAMNEKLREALEARGLAKDADETAAWAFLETLEVRKGVPVPGPTPNTPVAPANTVDEDLIRAEAIKAEQERIVEIRSMCEKFDCADDIATLVTENKTIDESRRAVMATLEERNTNGEGHRLPVNIEVGKDEKIKFREAAIDSIHIRSGGVLEKPADGAEDLAGYSLVELARESMRKAGKVISGRPLDLVGRAMTTSDFPYILADSANKSLFEGYDTAEETWPTWCATGSVSDFKAHTLNRAGEFADLDEIPEHGEYKYGERAEAKETYQVVTYGKLFAITRQTIINDDLNALVDVPRGHGESSARKVGDLPYAILTANAAMGDGTTLFHADHGNIGTGGVVSITTISEGIKLMKLQKDLSSLRRLNIRPRFCIAPVAIEGTVEQFFISDFEGTQAKPNLKNPYAGSYFTRVYEARLDDTSAAVFYLAGQKGKTVKVFFLNGVQKPYMETRQGWTVDGVEYKVRIDAVAKAVDWRALLRNAGA